MASAFYSHFIGNYNYQNNLISTTNLITQSVRVGTVKKFVFTSSTAVYGSRRTPMTEDMEPLPEAPYGISKLACEYDLKAAYEMFGLPYVIFRPHNVYGPGQNMYDKYRNVVGIFLNQLQAGKELTIFGDGYQTRKFSYISDVSYPIALSGLLEHVNNHDFSIGGDIATTVNKLARVTAEAWNGGNPNIIHLDGRNEVTQAESDRADVRLARPTAADVTATATAEMPSPLTLTLRTTRAAAARSDAQTPVHTHFAHTDNTNITLGRPASTPIKGKRFTLSTNDLPSPASVKRKTGKATTAKKTTSTSNTKGNPSSDALLLAFEDPAPAPITSPFSADSPHALAFDHELSADLPGSLSVPRAKVVSSPLGSIPLLFPKTITTMPLSLTTTLTMLSSMS